MERFDEPGRWRREIIVGVQSEDTVKAARAAKAGRDGLITILMAEDDADDRLMTRDAFSECRVRNELRFVEDGQQLMDYLLRRGEYADAERYPLPGVILLDLNMPRKDGRQALAEIKAHPLLKSIPVVVLTTSKAEEDILRTYDLGANSFITKPVTFQALVEVVGALKRYWVEIVDLPAETERFSR
jgi:CheY-like chemotaxis protein